MLKIWFCKDGVCAENTSSTITFDELVNLPGAPDGTNPFGGASPSGYKYFHLTFLFDANDFNKIKFAAPGYFARESTDVQAVIPHFIGVTSNIEARIEAALTTVPQKATYDGAHSSDLDITTLSQPQADTPLAFLKPVLDVIGATGCTFTSTGTMQTPDDQLPFGKSDDFCSFYTFYFFVRQGK